MKLTSQFMRKFYHLLAVALLIMGTLLPTVVTYAQEASAEETATTPIVAPVSSEEIKPEEVTPNPTPTSPTPAAPAQEESSQESSSESGSTGLRSADVNGVLKMSLNNNTGTDAKYTTNSHVGEVAVDGSGLNDTLEGAYVEIRVPAKYVETMAATAGGVAKAAGVLTQDGDNYLLTVPLNAIDRTTSGSFPFSIKFKDRLTPDGYSVQPRVAIRQADRRVIAGLSSDLTFNVKADKPQLQKLVKGNTLDMFVQQDVYGGETDGGDYLNSKAADVPFYFFLSPQGITNQTIQEYRANQTYRSYETIVIKDTLPTYEGVGGQTLTATFDPAKNPGWTDNGDGTVSYTVTNPDPASGGAETTLRNVRLRLSFPNAKYKNGNKQIVHKNNVELTMTPYQQGPSEPATVLNDDVPFTLTSELVPAGMFRKIANNASRLRLQPQANHVVEAFWSLAFRNTSALPVTQLVMEDTQLDPRMYAYSLTVSGTLSIPLEIYGVGEDGSETYLDTLSRTKRSIENIDDQAWGQVQEQVAKVQSGEIKDTEAVAATRKYKGIRIKLPAGEKHMPTTGFALQYRTRLLDPYNTKLLTDEKFYNNTATLDVALETEDGSEVRPRQLTSSARFIADKLEETVQFSKTTKVNQTGTLGEQVVYRLVFSNFVVSPARAYRNAKFIDVLPQGVTFKGVTEEEAADKGKIKNVEVVENYNNSGRTAVIIDLGTIPAFSDTKPNFPILVEGTINEGAIPSKIQNANNNEDNHAYFISDEYDPIPDGIKSSTLVDNKFGIQVNGKTPAQLIGASSVTTVNLPSEIASTKYIRRRGESFHTKPVITDYDEAFDYRLQTRNFSVLPMRHFVLYDRLPYSGDVNTSKFSNLLTGPLTVPEKYTVYYHTAADMTKNAGQEVGRDGWMTADQVADFTQVTAIKIVLNQGQVVEPGEIINFNVPMKAPAYTNGYINREKATNFFSTNRDANDLTSFGDTNAVVNQLPQYIPVAKKWVKEKNLDQVVFELFRKSQPRDVLASMTLNEANGWKGIFKRLDNGQLLDPNVTDYDVREVLPDRYALDYNITSSYDATNPGLDEDEHVYEITNERKVRPYYVVKKWEDDNNRLGKRVPIKVQLKQDGKDYREPLDITEADRWEITIPDLPIITNVKEIEYSADELNVPAGYYKEVVSNGNTTTITNKLPLPTGENVTSEGIQGASQSGTPNFTPGTVTIDGQPITVALKANSYRLVVDGQVTEATSTPALKNGQQVGTYTLDQATGQVTFQPNKDFTGQPDPVKVQVEDEHGTPATATYTPNVLGTQPTGQDVTSQGIQGASQTGTPSFTPGKVTIGGKEVEVPLKADSYRLVVNGQAIDGTSTPALSGGVEVGTYTLDQSTGQVTFQPKKDFVGTPDPVTVQVSDTNDKTATATYTPTVVGTKPSGQDKETQDIQGKTQSTTLTFTPGTANVGGTDYTVPLKDNSLRFVVDGAVSQETQIDAKDAAGKVIGRYTLDPASGQVTFEPNKDFVGTAAPAIVRAWDKNDMTADASYTPTVVGVVPNGSTKETTHVQGHEQSGLVEFTPGNEQVPMDDQVDAVFDNGEKEITIPKEGTYRVAKDGTVTFTPEKTFVGDGTGVTVVRVDKNGTKARGKYIPHVLAVKPSAQDAETTDIQGKEQVGQLTFTPGTTAVDGQDYSVPMAANSLQFLVDGQASTETTIPAKDANGKEIGTYTLNQNGQVTFQPNKDFVGDPVPVQVQAKDENGTPVVATYTPHVTGVKPVGLPATSTGIRGASQSKQVTFQPGHADVPMDDQVPAKLKDAQGQLVESLKVENQGTYTVAADGTVTFVPEKNFVGPAQAVTVVRVDKNGTPAEATYTPTVVDATPTSTNAETTDVQGQVQEGTVSFAPGQAQIDGQAVTVPLVENSLVFVVDGQVVQEKEIDAKDTDGKTIGTYKLNSETGQVTFTPHKDYVGTPVPATIQAHDTNDVTVTATYQPHVTGVTPSGKDVSSSGLQGASQTGQPVFTPGDAKVPITINDEQPAQFFVGGQAVTETSLPAMQNGVEVGTYTLDPKTGQVTFQPKADFVGTPDPVTVQVKDANGTPAKANYTPTVLPTSRQGLDKVSQDIQGKAQTGQPEFTYNPDPNNGGADQAIQVSAQNPAKFVVDGAVTDANQIDAKDKDGKVIGTYTLTPETGLITFQPNKDFVGTAQPATIQVLDPNGVAVSATYTPTVTPVTPTGTGVTSEGLQGQAQTGTPSFEAGHADVPITINDEQPARLVDPASGQAVNETSLPAVKDGKTVGTYTIDPKTGTVTFQPNKDFVGTPEPIQVEVKDANGTPAKASYTPTVTAVVPRGDNQTTTDIQGKTQSATLVFTPGSDKVPMDDTVDARFEDGSTEKKVEGQGTYTVAKDGTVTFVPEKSFVGTATPVTVKRQDVNGTVATATYTPIVTAVTPSGSPATSSGLQGASQTGTPSFTPGHPDVPIKIDADQPAQFVVAGKAVTETSIPATKDGQEIGTYTLDPLTGTVTFQPKKDFVGVPDPVTVQAKDANGTPATATYTPSVTGVTPSGNQVESYGLKGQTQTGQPSFTPGHDSVPMDDSVPATFSNGQNQLTVAGQGTYTLSPEGLITFTPEADFVGTADPVTIIRRDVNGTPAEGKYVPHVLDLVAENATSEDIQGKVQTGKPSAKDQTTGKALTPSAERPARLLDPATQEPVANDQLEAKDADGKVVGTYVLDRLTGQVTFTPNKDFVGTPLPAQVQFTNDQNVAVVATYTPTVTPVTPTGNQVESYGNKGQVQTGKPSFTPGHDQVPIDPAVAPTFEDGSKKLTVKDQGTYEVANDGTITFTPEANFVGTASPVVIVRVDTNGTPAKGTYTPHVLDIVPVDAESEDVQGKAQTGQLGARDQASGQAITPSASQPARLVDPATQAPTDASSVPALDADGKQIGTYTVDPLTGLVTFQPNEDFVGKPQAAQVVFQHESGISVTARYQPNVKAKEESSESSSESSSETSSESSASSSSETSSESNASSSSESSASSSSETSSESSASSSSETSSESSASSSSEASSESSESSSSETSNDPASSQESSDPDASQSNEHSGGNGSRGQNNRPGGRQLPKTGESDSFFWLAASLMGLAMAIVALDRKVKAKN